MLTYLPDVGLEVAHEIHSFFQDDHNRQVIRQLLERGIELQGETELHPEFAATATLADLLDKLNIPFIASTGAQRLAARFGSLEAIIAADCWICARSSDSTRRPPGRCATTSTTPNRRPTRAPWKRSCARSACTGKASARWRRACR